MDALQPLVSLRTSQGYRVATVDVQSIYDSWSFGRVDPAAIRDFLRYVVSTWNPAPIAVVLVGDGTDDPHNYLAYGNRNVIPPYLANVDPWLGETACDNCFAQLHGDDPQAETMFLIDIYIGRFPVADTKELADVVGKIVDYETQQDVVGLWRSLSVQLTDDYVRPNGQKDPAGNFPKLAEDLIRDYYPANIRPVRNYYNAEVDEAGLDDQTRAFLASIAPYIESNAEDAWQRSISAIEDGAGLVTFTGHSHHWQWATTDASSSVGRLFGLWDVLELGNRQRLPIVLSMTCFTSQFTKPAEFHATIDEHLVLYPNGGAVAVWGPAGLSVAHGHDILQRGFYKALWSAQPMTAGLGALILAGYTEIVTAGGCCQDIARTYLLLGDPLTTARVQPLYAVHLPNMQSVSYELYVPIVGNR
jgi:hypothetical protein